MLRNLAVLAAGVLLLGADPGATAQVVPSQVAPGCASLIRRADSLRTGAGYRRASLACDGESRRAEARGAIDSAAILAHHAARAADEPGDWGRAFSLYDRAVGLTRRTTDASRLREVVQGLAVAARLTDRPAIARQSYLELQQLASAAGDSSALAQAWHGLAMLAYESDSLTAAEFPLRRAIALRAELRDSLGLSESLELLGAIAWANGAADSALMHLRDALRLGVEDGEIIPTTALNVAVLQRELGRPDSALHYARLAYPILRRTGDRQELARYYNEVGLALVDLSFHDPSWRDSALAAYRQARPRVGAADRAALLNNIGVVHRLAGRLTRALAYYDSAATLARRAGDRPGLAMVLNNMGLVHFDRRAPARAIPLYQEALRLRRALGDPQGEWQTLHNLGDLYSRAFPEPRVSDASRWYAQADSVLRQVGRRAGGDAERLSYADQKWNLDLYRAWTALWLAAGDPAAALAAVERGRAQALLELRRGSSTTEPAPADLAADGRALARSIARPGRATLAYLMQDSALVSWLITPEGEVTVQRVALSADSLARLVRAFRTNIARRDLDSVAARGARAAAGARHALPDSIAPALLAEALLPTVLRERMATLSELVVVPTGMLALVPFAALRPGPEQAPLGFSLAIRYAPSLQTLVELEREMAGAAPAAELPALVIGDPELSAGPAAGLPRLPAAAEEARRVAELFGVTPLLGAEATEARVSELLPRARVIHLATHGITYGTTADYRDSHLALASGRGEFDGRLTVGELLDGAVPLRAELVVLSACETALGNLRESEGTVGLQRAFLSRGARSVLVSLWPVSDRATELLMGAFYREWTGAGSILTRAEALRRAQRWLATETEYRSPRYWAAFQLVGGG